MTLAGLLLLSVLAAEPVKGSCSGATGREVMTRDVAQGSAKFDQVKAGWTRARLEKHLGPPNRCDGDVWTYSAGNPDGPLTTARITVKKGVVTSVERSGAACILKE